MRNNDAQPRWLHARSNRTGASYVSLCRGADQCDVFLREACERWPKACCPEAEYRSDPTRPGACLPRAKTLAPAGGSECLNLLPRKISSIPLPHKLFIGNGLQYERFSITLLLLDPFFDAYVLCTNITAHGCTTADGSASNLIFHPHGKLQALTVQMLKASTKHYKPCLVQLHCLNVAYTL